MFIQAGSQGSGANGHQHWFYLLRLNSSNVVIKGKRSSRYAKWNVMKSGAARWQTGHVRVTPQPPSAIYWILMCTKCQAWYQITEGAKTNFLSLNKSCVFFFKLPTLLSSCWGVGETARGVCACLVFFVLFFFTLTLSVWLLVQYCQSNYKAIWNNDKTKTTIFCNLDIVYLYASGVGSLGPYGNQNVRRRAIKGTSFVLFYMYVSRCEWCTFISF